MPQQPQTLPPQALADKPFGIIIDVRTAMEHGEQRLARQHTHIPLDQLDAAAFLRDHNLGPETPLYLLCRSGKRATQAAEKFIAAGHQNVTVVEGGITACADCGIELHGHSLPAACARPQGPMTPKRLSLERQVRIAAGLIAASGAAAGLLINPLFTLVPLFIGCGLVFAGVTDRCGLALVLTKAPWNR